LARAGWDVQADGLFGAPELTVVVGEKAHSALIKALGLVGLGRERVRRVPADGQGRMRADCLPEDVTGPAVICAQAGEVNTGAFDPFGAIVEWARRREAWIHVDGAFGLWALADSSRGELTAGLADADSWATDAHKWLNVPYDCGIVLARRPGDLRRSFAGSAGYLPPDTGFEAMHHTPQSSQRARQVEVWAVLRTLGRHGVADLVARTCDHARAMADSLRRAGLEVLNDVVLNQVLVRADADDIARGPHDRDRAGPDSHQRRLRVGPWRVLRRPLGVRDDRGNRRRRGRDHRRGRRGVQLDVLRQLRQRPPVTPADRRRCAQVDRGPDALHRHHDRRRHDPGRLPRIQH
jgi:glutamate/tyrosine decarboxylase-like PLP-dependent enzyme